MVRRSLLAKSLLYASLVVCLSVPAATWIGRILMDQGRQAEMSQFLGPQFQALGEEIERSAPVTGPTQAQLTNFEMISHHALRFVPWEQTSAYPAELVTQRQLVDPKAPNPHGPEGAPHHWLRLERDGKPFGALELTPQFHRLGGPGGRGGRNGRPPGPGGPGGPIPWYSGLWVLLLVAIIVPPLWLWVIRPLRAMVAVANRLGAGDLDTPVAINRRDEFGTLERAFETMRSEVKRTMDQKERLLIDVSHEIRGPLSRMTLALPLLRQQGMGGPILDLFAREMKAADDLLERVLQLGRGLRSASLQAEPLDLADLAEQLAVDREIVAGQHGVKLTTACEPATVLGDGPALSIAMANLVDNALKYTGAGGNIRIVTAVEGSQAVFRVIDDGPGIAADHLPYLFEPFYRPDDSRSRETGGTGLGLSIVRNIARAHGGDATLTSNEGQGTTAEIRLPAKTET
ncbi:MAG: two-component sensor histidine kinase [Cyanobacteria bacterium RYN_339]|nr:two-component sensor histidine kinase [Cyanobacteria bacterium RYN_339]